MSFWMPGKRIRFEYEISLVNFLMCSRMIIYLVLSTRSHEPILEELHALEGSTLSSLLPSHPFAGCWEMNNFAPPQLFHNNILQ